MKTPPIPQTLKELSALLPDPVYIVGGYVRDALLNLNCYDIDICGASTPGTVFSALENSPFSVKTTSAKMMTLKIKKGDEEYEYTTFRKESYVIGHAPETVEATDDIAEDAKRRDYKANAVYYDVKNETLVDPLKGLDDIKNKVLSTTREPEKVFSEDGLRLMRLARFAGQLGFSVEAETLCAAKENAQLIKDIAPERIRDELDKILVADTVHGIEDGHIKALKILDETGVLEYILPEITLGKGMKQRADFHKYDVFNHILETVRFARSDVRLAALMHDVAKPYCFARTGRYRGHDVEGERLAREVMTRLRYPKRTIERVSRLVKLHMYDLKCEAKESTLRKFVQENVGILDELLALKEADSKGSGMPEAKNPTAARIRSVYEDMVREGVPFSIKDLKVGGNDLDSLPEAKRGSVLKEILVECAVNPQMNDRKKQLDYIRRVKDGIRN